MNSNLNLPALWVTLNKIELLLGLTPSQMSIILEITPEEYLSLKEKRGPLSLFSIMKLTEYLEIGFVPLMTGQVDYKALTERLLKGNIYLPERYAKAAFAKRRVPIYMLDYVTEKFGQTQRNNILRHLQLNEEIFNDPNAPINILFTMDLCDYLKKYRLMDDQALIKMGRHSSQSARSPLITQPLKQSKSVKEVYEIMCTELMEKYFEKNYLYQLNQASNESCTVIGLPNEEIEDQLQLKNVGSAAVCSLRSGFGSSFPDYLGLPYAKVKKTACVHQGDSECRYEFNYEHAEYVLKEHQNFLYLKNNRDYLAH